MAIEYVTIFGTGLIGTSIALALRQAGYGGELHGIDRNAAERSAAYDTGSFTAVAGDGPDARLACERADVIVLALPVLAILDRMLELAPALRSHQLVTDVGSTKLEIARRAAGLFSRPDGAAFLPGHPMAGRERGGAAMADANLFRGATWLFTPIAPSSAVSEDWRHWVERMGARSRDLDPQHHDELCAWVSHLPQFLATALAASLEQRFGDDEAVAAIGGRALREMTRLGASPYSMWRDIALTNSVAIGSALHALEQELAHLREGLRTPELREEFAHANRLRLPPIQG